MSEERNQSDDGRQDGFRANPGYVLGQLAKALTTAEEHADRQTRERARQKVEKWAEVFAGLTSGTLAAGSRTPLTGVPAWATLEVVTGGFATSALLAGGELLPHEQQLLAELSISAGGQERQALNSFFLTETGMSRLRGMLASGRYEIEVPEEGALLVVAWLLDQGHADQARAVLDEIGPFFDKLRFYPIPAEQPRRFGSRVYLQDVATTIASLEKIQPNPRILAQKEAIEVWAPLYDRTVELLLETVKGEPPHFVVQENAASRNVAGGWPCQFYPEGWQARAQGLLDDYARLRRIHCLCKKPDRKKENFAQLRAWLQRCINNPTALSEHDVGRVRELLARFVSRRGSPQSAQCRQLRERQTRQSDGPTYHQVSQVVLSRLRKHPRQFGIEEFAPVVQPVSPQEAERFTIEAGADVPTSIFNKVRRCLIETADTLIERGIITSAEVLARVLPQVTSGLRAAGITDPSLRQLYASIYQAFRRRRSLLLVNLESQVRMEELPWVAAMDQYRREEMSDRELSKETLKEIVSLAVISFPQAILPNKLLQEFRALAKNADLTLPLVDEVAADIFMGEFSAKYTQAAKRAADLLQGTLYETYYDIDYATVKDLAEPKPRRAGFWHRSAGRDEFAKLCSERAGVSYGGWNVAKHGMIIEQQQILTTQNLAVLFAELDLIEELRGHLLALAERSFVWICSRQQTNAPTRHAELIMLKNTAYAWRQMIFYLAFLAENHVRDFFTWADQHLVQQPSCFRDRFYPAVQGLRLAAAGTFREEQKAARRFLGWTNKRHWLSQHESPLDKA